MPDAAYATFIEDCRQERAHLVGLVEALEGRRMNPGMPIAVPAPLAEATATVLAAFQTTLTHLNTLLDAYEANPDG